MRGKGQSPIGGAESEKAARNGRRGSGADARSRAELVPIARAIAGEIGGDRVIEDLVELQLLERDLGDPPEVFTQLLDAQAPAFAVRPRSTGETAAAVRTLSREQVPMTPRGLSSTGVGGALPIAGGAVLDLSGLRGVTKVDVEERTVTVRAGTTFFFLERELERHGVGLLARPTNAFGSVGGWAASGGLGLGSLGAGHVSDHVERVEVVLPGGRIERLGRHDAGFGDFFDTEGQLGIITELTLRVQGARRGGVSGVVFASVDDAVKAVRALIDEGMRPRTAILAGQVSEHGSLKGVAEGELLLTEAAPDAPSFRWDRFGGKALPAGAAQALWTRRFFPMDLPHGPVFLASEAMVPSDRVARLLAEARQLASRYRVPLHVHAHAFTSDDALQFLALVLFPTNPKRPVHHLMITPLAAALTSRAVSMGARAYGIGIWNSPFAEHRFGAERFASLQRRKHQLDPDGLLNPGKFFSLGTSARLLPVLMRPSRYGPSLRLAAGATPWLLRKLDDPHEPSSTAERCISCGACVPVCPAVVASGCESVSARAKLGLMRRLASNEPAATQELLGSQRCLKCGQCAEVCARSLALVEAWEELERDVRRRVPDSEAFHSTIATFAAQVDASREPVLDLALP